MDDATQTAVRIFQTSQKMSVTGEVDDVTRQKLLSLHGH